jgi:light-regulated signal transduction histidine kinase (bacteriophytochrome)
MQNAIVQEPSEKIDAFQPLSQPAAPDPERERYVQMYDSEQSKRDCAEEQILRVKKCYEERINRQLEQYQQAIGELDAFSYSIAHDLRAPLRAVGSLVCHLTEQQAWDAPPEAIRTMNAIKESVDKMQEMIENLLHFSKTNGLAQNITEVDMTALVHSVLDDFLGTDSGPSLTVFIEPLHPARADTAMIRQVWVNLISNALKYTRRKPARQVKITSRTAGGEIVYRISDNGVGFNMEYAHKLFGVFQRLHCAEEYEGTGVGLAIVQRIIRRHGGRVWAESVEDNGASFYFTLPNAYTIDRSMTN